MLLQKPNTKSKAKDHAQHLERRLQQWSEGDLEGLMSEGRTIQLHFNQKPHQRRSDKQTTKTFSKLMIEGKVRAAMRLISESSCGSPLNLDSCTGPNPTDETVREILSKKHPPAQPPRQSSLIISDAPTIELHPIHFEKIDGPTIRSTALKTDGAAGPSGLDAAAWKRMSTSFKSTSVDLCDAVATIGRWICSSFVDPKGLSARPCCLPTHCTG